MIIAARAYFPMKKHTRADPTKKWEGFRFTAYAINWEKLETMPLTLEGGDLPPEDRGFVDRDPKTGEQFLVPEPPTKDRTEEAAREGLTVGSAYRRIARSKFEMPEQTGILRLTVKTENGEIVLKGSSFNYGLLRELLSLVAEGIEPFYTEWFWFDSDSCRDDPQESYSFFVVFRDRIVRESVSFGDHHNSGFDPDVFKSESFSDSIWFNDADWREARTRLLYRKFYTETRTGQLMVLRPGEPVLHNYARPQTRNIEREIQFVTLLKSYRLLWVALPLLVALAFPSLKDYMAIVAAALGASFLWLCWETRHLGRP
jgi:hypothetical protein